MNAKDTVIALIDRKRNGGQIDQQLVNKVLEIFVGIIMEAYEIDFEAFMLEDTVAYDKMKALLWTSRSNFMTKTQYCLELEKEKVNHYLHASSEETLMEEVQKELIS